MVAASESPIVRALSAANLPGRFDGWRILTLGGGDGCQDRLTELGAEAVINLDRPAEDAELRAGGFDLVVCGSDLDCDAHPLALYAWIRRAIKLEGTLIVGSRMLPDPAKSQYARFVPAAASGGSDRWVPGRLAFRWMVEVSGFDVETWLVGEDEAESPDLAYLQARAADRTPPLDLERQPLRR